MKNNDLYLILPGCSNEEWQLHYLQLMEAKAEAAAADAFLRGKLRGQIPLDAAWEDMPFTVSLHPNDSEIEGIDLFKVRHKGKGKLFCELVIWDDGVVHEVPRSRPPVTVKELHNYRGYAEAQGKSMLLDDLLGEYPLTNKPQKELMGVLDTFLNRIHNRN